MLKSYAHTSEPVRQRLVEGAHSLGIPVSSHDIYPAALFGSDSVEHLDPTVAGRGYSTKVSALHNVYDDVVQILTKSQMTLTPTSILLVPSNEVVTAADRADPRWAAQPAWMNKPGSHESMPIPAAIRENARKSLLKLHRAGVPLLTGTDAPLTPVGTSTRREMEEAVKAGLTPFEALKMATTNPATLLGEQADLGSVEVGKLADLAIVEGNPLADIRNARNVRQVIVNGRVYGPEALSLK